MANYKSLRRYYYIMEMFRDGKTASFSDIKKHLEANDMSISERTLQRDVNQIRVDFSVDIVYNRSLNHYKIDLETSIGLPGFYKFLELSLTTELLQEHLRENKESLLKYIQFEPMETFSGFQNLKELLQAILLKRWVSFEYTRFVDELGKPHQIVPCLLKRYQNRWYVIGKTSSGRTATFGLDRITSLKRLSKTFRAEDVEIPASLNDVVGLDYSGKSERVVIKSIPIQAKYLKSLPLHDSQKVLSESKEGTVFEYRLIPNFELVQAILRLGDQVTVLEPATLIKEITSIAHNLLKSYKSKG